MKPFALLTYSIIALVIVGLAVTLMLQFFPSEDIYDKIRDGVDISQTSSNLGKTIYVGKLQIDKDLIITKTALNLNDVSLAVECNDPSNCCSNGEKCSEPIEWNYKAITFKRNENIQVYSRCISYFEELVCRVYFGQKPAQAEILNVDYSESNRKIDLIVKVTNSGSSQLTLGKNSLRVLKKVGEDWLDTEKTYEEKEINLILPGQEHSFVWETKLLTGGEYKLEFKFEGENAGYDINGLEIKIGSNQNCLRDKEREEIQDLNTTHVRVLKYCTGCNYSYECLAKWGEKNDGNNYEPYLKEATYYVRKMFDAELCDRTLGEETGYFSLQGQCIPGYKITAVTNLGKGICCIRQPEAITNPCETAPESTECTVNWLPSNTDYTCPIEPDISAYSSNCNVNEWFNVSQTIE